MNRTDASMHQVCKSCVMDTTDPDIRFDDEGVCNHCRTIAADLAALDVEPAEQQRRLDALAVRIRRASTGRPYDVVVGLSGGVDSSFVGVLAHDMGLRVLAVHFDNGWDAEVAVANIHAIVGAFGFDLETYVIDWPEFRDLQRSFLRAGVVDIEMLTDHAILAAMFECARKHDVGFVLSGDNVATEHGMPPSWVWNKTDLVNIKAIQKRFGSVGLKSFPNKGLLKNTWRRKLNKSFELIEIFNLIGYKKHAALERLKQETGWQAYGGKHHESTFTKFYQAYILPTKFGIDKRKVHLSALIRNGEISRTEALKELQQPLYDDDALRRDKAYVLKKLGFSEDEFDSMMAEAPVPHEHYPTDLVLRGVLKGAQSNLRRFGLPV